jgi:hypothetical protein
MPTGERRDQIRGREFRQSDINLAGLYGLVGDLSVIDPDDAAAAGTSTRLARADHQHAATAAAAVQLNDTNAEGSATSWARSDHNHALPDAVGKGHKGSAGATSDSAAVTVETVVLTISSFVFKDGRAYRITYGSGVTCDVVGDAVFAVRKTNAAGTIYADGIRYPCRTGANTYAAESTRYVRRTAGGGDLTTDVVLTLNVITAANATHRGSATRPRFFEIEDCGLAADFANVSVAVT